MPSCFLFSFLSALALSAQVRQRLTSELRASISCEAQLLFDLIAKLLTYDSAERLSAVQALAHPFFAPILPFPSILAPWVPQATMASGEPATSLPAGVSTAAATVDNQSDASEATYVTRMDRAVSGACAATHARSIRGGHVVFGQLRNGMAHKKRKVAGCNSTES